MIDKILDQFPPHEHYVEPFGHSAITLLNKTPCGGVETYNDRSSIVADFFRVLADPEDFETFHNRVDSISEAHTKEECINTWDEQENRIERTAMWFVGVRDAFDNNFESVSTAILSSNRDKGALKWRKKVDRLPQVHDRLLTVQVEHDDWKNIIRRYQDEGYLVYCDPCNTEMDENDHQDLIDGLLEYNGAVVLRGVRYETLGEQGWEKKTLLDGVVWRNPEAIKRSSFFV